ncbi:MAG TPA: OsmC family peroxiredoxin [Aquifex aeolicus]|nr:OsmC family peroxiredoxin [Aquifex aeolicus]
MEEKEVILTLSEEGTYRTLMPSGEILVGEKALKPMELLLAAIGGCSGVDVYHILKKKRQEVKDIQIRVQGKRRDTYPRIYEEIEIKYIAIGKVEEKALEQAVKLSVEKYCSVLAMVKNSANVKFSWEVKWEE